jgi:hypothetical protein
MRAVMFSILFVLVGIGTALIARGQYPTTRPGELTEGYVWIKNRSADQAIAVDLVRSELDAPLRVQMPRPTWEYRVVEFPPPATANAARVQAQLDALGAEGWEPTSLRWPDNPLVIFKRQR